jgi:hypothetical protein
MEENKLPAKGNQITQSFKNWNLLPLQKPTFFWP